MYEDIILEPVQEELLIKIVEAARNMPLNNRQKFYVIQSNLGACLEHSNIPEDKSEIYYGDIEVLANEGLIAPGYGSQGISSFDVTPLGFKYYEFLKSRQGEPVERIESTIRKYLNAHDFQKKYSKAFEKWSAAENLLWKQIPSSNSQQSGIYVVNRCRNLLIPS